MTEPQTDLEEIKEIAAREKAFRESIDNRVNVVSAETITLTPEQLRARKRRNMWIALAVGAFVVLVFFITIAKLRAGQPI
jgi:hypothetical protein